VAIVSPFVEELVRYSDLGGLSDQIRTIKKLVDFSLLHSHLFTRDITFLDYMSFIVGAFLSLAALCLELLVKFNACVIDEASMDRRHHQGYYCLDCLEQARALEQLPVRLVSLCNQEPWVGQFHREIEQALRAVFAAAEQATPLW
jgi:hypothetical protein